MIVQRKTVGPPSTSQSQIQILAGDVSELSVGIEIPSACERRRTVLRVSVRCLSFDSDILRSGQVGAVDATVRRIPVIVFLVVNLRLVVAF